MTAAEFRAIRERLGLSRRELAEQVLKCSHRTVAGYEGGKPIPGPVAQLMHVAELADVLRGRNGAASSEF